MPITVPVPQTPLSVSAWGKPITDEVNRLTGAAGTAGVAWGILARIASTNGGADQVVAGSEVALHGTTLNQTISRPASRWTRFHILLQAISASGSAAQLVVKLFVGGAQRQIWAIPIPATYGQTLNLYSALNLGALTNAAVTWTVQAVGQNINIQCFNYQATVVAIEDCGPVV